MFGLEKDCSLGGHAQWKKKTTPLCPESAYEFHCLYAQDYTLCQHNQSIQLSV